MESNKLPLKRVELSLTKFNEVAIPHHLDLLRQHRANILKYEELGDYARVRMEQTHARRVTSQLRSLLAELESLRAQVQVEDYERFDKLTKRSRDLTLQAVMEYLETSPLSINRRGDARGAGFAAGSAISTDSVGLVLHERDGEDDGVRALPDGEIAQLQVHDQSLRECEEVLRGWSDLQEEVRALHDVWQNVHEQTLRQRHQVSVAAASTEVAAENVAVARTQLLSAERLRAGAVCFGGAAVGALVGGPVGLLLGAKAGAAALLAGGTLGFIGARAIGTRRVEQIDTERKNQ